MIYVFFHDLVQNEYMIWNALIFLMICFFSKSSDGFVCTWCDIVGYGDTADA